MPSVNPANDYNQRNRESLESLRACLARLGEDDFITLIDEEWTIGATLAHLAFWDRRALTLIEIWSTSGVRVIPANADAVNADQLPEWLGMPGGEAAASVLEVGAALNARIGTLPAKLVAEIRAVSPRTLDRSLHRQDHQAQIEETLRRASTSHDDDD